MPPHARCFTFGPVQAQLEFFRSRLLDSIEEKQKKTAQARDAGSRSRGDNKTSGDKRKRADVVDSCLPPTFALKPDEQKADLEEITSARPNLGPFIAFVSHLFPFPATMARAGEP
jgi:hypothetical protein